MEIERYGDLGFLSETVAHGEMVWISGMIAAPHHETVEAQTRDILAAIDRRLASAGSRKDRLLSVNIWLTDMADWAAMNAVWVEWLGDAPAPARAVVGAALVQSFKVEIAAVALRDRP